MEKIQVDIPRIDRDKENRIKGCSREFGLRKRKKEIEKYRNQCGLTKRYKEIEVDRQEMEKIQVDVQRINWDKENRFEIFSREFGLIKR